MAAFTPLITGLSFTECRDGATAETIATVPNQPSGLGFLPDGRMLIVSTRDRKILLRDLDGSLTQHADLSGLATGHLNDMLVDHDGRAWVGNFGFDLMVALPPTRPYSFALTATARRK